MLGQEATVGMAAPEVIRQFTVQVVVMAATEGMEVRPAAQSMPQTAHSACLNSTVAFNSGEDGVAGSGGQGGSGSPAFPGIPPGPPGNTGNRGKNGAVVGGLKTVGGLLINTLLATNNPGSNCFGTITDAGHNLSSDGSCAFTDIGSLNNTDPKLGPLADNGGPTLTMALLPGSPAIDAGDDSARPADRSTRIPAPVWSRLPIRGVRVRVGQHNAANDRRISLEPGGSCRIHGLHFSGRHRLHAAELPMVLPQHRRIVGCHELVSAIDECTVLPKRGLLRCRHQHLWGRTSCLAMLKVVQTGTQHH